jgi:hypothetical protein
MKTSSSVNIVTRLGAGCGVQFPAGTKIFSLPLHPNQFGHIWPLTQAYRGWFRRVKWLVCKAHYLPPSNAEVKNV